VATPEQDEVQWGVVRVHVYSGARAQGAPHDIAEDLAQAAVERWLVNGADPTAVVRVARSRGRFDAKSWHRSSGSRLPVPLTEELSTPEDVLATAIRRQQLEPLRKEAAMFRSRFERLAPVVQLALLRKLRDGWSDRAIAAEQTRLRGRRIGRTAVVHQRRRVLKDLPALTALAGDREREGFAAEGASVPVGKTVSDLSEQTI
jgi:hypothetical protein